MITTAEKPLTKEGFGITSERMWLFSLYMYTIGSESFGNGRESAKRAKYKGTNNALDQRQHELVSNSKVRAVKAALLAEIREKMDWNRETNLKALLTHKGRLDALLLDHPKNVNYLTAYTAVCRELNASSGQHSSTLLVNEPPPPDLTEDEIDSLRVMSRHLIARRLAERPQPALDSPKGETVAEKGQGACLKSDAPQGVGGGDSNHPPLDICE